MKTKTKIKAGDGFPALSFNHNGALVRASGMKTKTKIKAGDGFPALTYNHNGALVRA